MPDRLPVNARRLHGHVGAAVLGQPGGQRQQARRGRAECTDLAFESAAARQTNAGDYRILVHVEPRAARVENVHGSLQLLRRRRRAPLDQSLNSALPDRVALGAIGGASDAPGPTNTRARSHHRKSRPLRRRPPDTATGFIHGGSAFRWRTNTGRLACVKFHRFDFGIVPGSTSSAPSQRGDLSESASCCEPNERTA